MKIVTVKPSKRCEICHQADCFDPVVGRCSRCETVTVPARPEPSVKKPEVVQGFSGQIRQFERFRKRAIAAAVVFLVEYAGAVVLSSIGYGKSSLIAFGLMVPTLLVFIFGRFSRFQCPSCGNDPIFLGRFCPECGSPTVSKSGVSSHDRECGNCAAALAFREGRQYKIRYCPHCGTVLNLEGF